MTDTTHPGAAAPPPAREAEKGRRWGLAGRVASAFVESPLTPLLLIAFFLVGTLGMLVTPREEDPQISVPMVDILVAYPGASAEEVNHLISEPLERLMSEISGVKHVYSMSREGLSMVTVRFEVGEQMEPSLVKLFSKLQSHMDVIPKGVLPPLVKPKSIDDVPIVTVTLSSNALDPVQLRKLGLDVELRLKSLRNTGQSFVTGGSLQQVRIEIDPSKIAAYGLTLGQVAQAINAANQHLPAGDVIDGNRWFNVYTGEFLKNAAEIGDLIVALQQNRPVYLRDIAAIRDGESEAKSIVDNSVRLDASHFSTAPAVTVAVAKKHGTNGVDVAESILREVKAMQGTLIPSNVTVTISRDYGATARDKVSHLIFKLFLVSALVTVLALVTMGLRPAIIVLITIPAVLLMSLAVAYLLRFTINRVSMFALVFAIGILVDDAIVVVENIYRRWLDEGRTDDDLTADAVDEVGNPTILATFTVIAALLPMGFVTDMMGPYMLPIPVLSSAAMMFSLFAAFVFVPWLAARVKPSMGALRRATHREHRQAAAIGKVYGGVIKPIMRSRPLAWITLLAIVAAMLGAVAMFPLEMVAFKMLPFDNKSELDVVIDMPEGTDLFATANLAHRLGDALKTTPEVSAFQTYVGASSPFNFNGLVRHYYMRQEPWQADIAVQLVDKELRERSSHDIASAVRSLLDPIAATAHARLTVAEAPPGPPVLAPVVVELYGPTAETRREVARHIMQVMEHTPHVADVNTYMEAPHDQIEFHVDRQRAKMFGVSVEDINRELAMATGGFEVGALQQTHNLEQAVMVLQVPLATRVNLGNLLVLPVRTQTGATVPLSELGQFEPQPVDPPIYHKDLRPLEYVTGDVIGRLGAPLYGMLAIDSALKSYVTPDGKTISGNYFSRPDNTSVSGFKWDGEWQVTYVTFRDMGIAFMAALVLIYILVVAEFRSFIVPLVIMAPIPLTMIGIVPGHWLLGADFTATSMIGFIALAGIIVRNSILLVEFARERVAEGLSVPEAITLAGHVRLRPIMITALALVIGSMVLLTDPIFQGMAVSLLFGSLVATFLTLVVIPMGCVTARKYFHGRLPHGGAGGAPHGGAPGPGGPTPPAGGGPGGAPPTSGPEPSATPGRPARLARKAEAEATVAAAPSLDEAIAGPTRPPRLVRKSEAETPAPPAPDEAPAAPGRPPRLVRKSEADAAAPGRPPRPVRKSEAEQQSAVAPTGLEPAPSARSPRRAKRGGPAEAAEVGARPIAKARPRSPDATRGEAATSDLEGGSE
jgi:multidrug efflux pump subunit AcrB